MTRGTVDDLESAHPIGLQLPGLFQDDEVAQAFVSGLDPLLAPLYLTLDSLDSYVDPWLAPRDFLAWVAEWVSAEWDESLDEMEQRAVVARAAELQGWAGTVKGLADLIELLTGARPEIDDNGGVAWTVEPGGDLPGTAEPRVTIRIRVAGLAERGPERDDRIERIKTAVHRLLPAHVPATVEVTGA